MDNVPSTFDIERYTRRLKFQNTLFRRKENSLFSFLFFRNLGTKYNFALHSSRSYKGVSYEQTVVESPSY